MSKRPTNASIATIAALALPLVATFLLASGLFGSGSDNNGWVRSLPGAAILSVPAIAVLWLLYRRLGQVQASSPSLGRVVSFSITFAGMFWLFAVAVGLYAAPYSQALAFLLASLLVFLEAFLCLFIGGWVQWLTLRPNSSFKPNPPRHTPNPDSPSLSSPSDMTRGGSA